MSHKPRLDELLVARGMFADVHAAQAAILAGEVVVGQHRETAAGRRVDADAAVRLKVGKTARRAGFVSRGGVKLEHALRTFDVDVAGCACADLGASTGGFTDCLLQHGAAHVSAIDVGHADFAWSLRNDARVSLFERTNVRGVDVAAVGGPFDIVVSDLSFISLAHVLDDVVRLLAPHATFVSLVKPQFEAACEDVPHGGVVEDGHVHRCVLADVVEECAACGLHVQGLCYSPIRGSRGNIEFLIEARFHDCARARVDDAAIERVVREAHDVLGG